jgi:hypothetical protein
VLRLRHYRSSRERERTSSSGDEMTQRIHSSLSSAIGRATDLISFLDECPVGSLLLLAVACRLAVSGVDSRRSLIVPRIAAGIFLFGYFTHCFLQGSADFTYLFAALLRAICGCQVVWSATAVATSAARVVLATIRSVHSHCRNRRP